MALARRARVPVTSSFFSAPADHLDPRIFEGDTVRAEVRNEILHILVTFLEDAELRNVTEWSNVWLAGSGVSYQWEAARDPGDLDCLIGIDYVLFRQDNPDYEGLSDDEIAAFLNVLMHDLLWPTTAAWHGYELTFYVNPDSLDITAIKPYAAYNLLSNSWTVHPSQQAPIRNPTWDAHADIDHAAAEKTIKRYNDYLTQVQNATNPAHRTNAEVYLNMAVEDAVGLYDVIHRGRKESFSRTGQGYQGEGNYRWQAGKERGTVQALKAIVEWDLERRRQSDLQTYGIVLPDADTLLLRSMLED